MGVERRLYLGPYFEVRSPTKIERIDGRRIVHVTADVVRGKANANEVVRTVQAEVLPGLLKDFPRLSYNLGGDQKRQRETIIPLFIGAQVTNRLLGQRTTVSTVPDARYGLAEHLCQAQSTGSIPFQDVECHTLCGLGSDTRQTAQGIDQLREQRHAGSLLKR